VGSETFVEEVRTRLAARAGGRDKRPLDHGMELREQSLPYNSLFDPEKSDIGVKKGLV
jgi:hypothetical protein